MLKISFITCFMLFHKSVSICTGGSYLNLCGACVGGITGVKENFGVDQCNVCHGNGTCLGCDGVVNSKMKWDSCGKCLSQDDPVRNNDCTRMNYIYPNVIDRALGNNIVSLTAGGAGLTADKSVALHPKCQALPEQNQDIVPSILDTSTEAWDLELKMAVGESLGLFSITCQGVHGSAMLRIVDSLLWKTVHVEPQQLFVDKSYQLVLSVEGDRVGEGPVWCYLVCAGLSNRVITGLWQSKGVVACHNIVPRQAAPCDVGVTATEDAANDLGSSGRSARLSILNMAPHIRYVEFDQDLGNLLVKFDANVQLTQPCEKIFKGSPAKSFDMARCFVSGDLLVIGLAEHQSSVPPFVELLEGNGIRRMGSADPSLSPECQPSTLPISTQKVLPPNLSLSVPSVMCHQSEDLRVASIGGQLVNYEWSVPPPAVRLGSQRENLKVWQNVRDLQSNLNHEPGNAAHIDGAELLKDAAYRIQVRGTNVLGAEQAVSSALVFSPSAPISVKLSAPPSINGILAEVNISACIPLIGGLRFTWRLNGSSIPGAGRMVFIDNLMPGSYNVSCTVGRYPTSEILATGWVLTQVLHSEEEAVLSPAEQVVGTMDTVKIKAYTTYDIPLGWMCFTPENYTCLVPGPAQIKVEDIVDSNNGVLIIHPGTLAVGRYVWKLKNVAGSEALVIVRDGIPPLVEVLPIPPYVNPSLDMQLTGEAHRLVTDCSLTWSSVFHVGFNYFNLLADVGLGDTLKILPGDGSDVELPLIVPTAQGHWTGLMADASYLLRLSAACPAPLGTSHVDIPVIVNVPPTISAIQVSPTEGLALQTVFKVSGGIAKDIIQNYPLKYQWTIQDGSLIIPFEVGSSPRDIYTFLPPGRVSISLEVCDVHKTCSTASTVAMVVSLPETISESVLLTTEDTIRERILEGSTLQGLGQAIIAVKTLTSMANSNKNEKAHKQLESILELTDDAIFTRSKDLTLSIAEDPVLAESGLEFLQIVLSNMEMLKPSQLSLDIIVELKDTITQSASSSQRIKRSINTASRPKRNVDLEKLAEVAFNLESTNFENNPTPDGRNHFLEEVKKQINLLCNGDVSASVRSKLVDAWVQPKRQSGELTGISHPKKEFEIKLNGRKGVQCIAVAAYNAIVFTYDSLLNKVYEVVLIKGKNEEKKSTNTMMSLIAADAKLSEASNVNCAKWNSSSWESFKPSSLITTPGPQVTCKFREAGYFSVTGVIDESLMKTTTTTTTTTTTMATTTSTVETTPPVQTTAEVNEDLVITTSVEPESFTIPSTIALASTPTETVIGLGIKPKTNRVLFDYGAQFKIEDDFDKVVDGNVDKLRESITIQLAEEMGVTKEDIVVGIERGSILVTVFFLESLEEDKATAVVNKLTSLVSQGQLKLKSHQNIPLDIPQQNITFVAPSTDSQAATIRTATYTVLGMVIALVLLILFLAARKQPSRPNVPLHGPYKDDLVPCYLDFSDPTLEGSSPNLSRYKN